MKAARTYRCDSRIGRQFAQIHTENAIRLWNVVMKFLILLCVLAPICASQLIVPRDGWLMEDLRDRIVESVRVRRQAPQGQHQQQQAPHYRPYSQAPAQIKQLLQFQQARDPVVNIPASPPPNFGSGHQANPQVQTQSQAANYRPNIQYGNAPQQPTYQNQAASVAAQYRPQGQHQGQPQQNPQQGHQPQYNQG